MKSQPELMRRADHTSTHLRNLISPGHKHQPKTNQLRNDTQKYIRLLRRVHLINDNLDQGGKILHLRLDGLEPRIEEAAHEDDGVATVFVPSVGEIELGWRLVDAVVVDAGVVFNVVAVVRGIPPIVHAQEGFRPGLGVVLAAFVFGGFHAVAGWDLLLLKGKQDVSQEMGECRRDIERTRAEKRSTVICIFLWPRILHDWEDGVEIDVIATEKGQCFVEGRMRIRCV